MSELDRILDRLDEEDRRRGAVAPAEAPPSEFAGLGFGGPATPQTGPRAQAGGAGAREGYSLGLGKYAAGLGGYLGSIAGGEPALAKEAGSTAMREHEAATQAKRAMDPTAAMIMQALGTLTSAGGLSGLGAVARPVALGAGASPLALGRALSRAPTFGERALSSAGRQAGIGTAIGAGIAQSPEDILPSMLEHGVYGAAGGFALPIAGAAIGAARQIPSKARAIKEIVGESMGPQRTLEEIAELMKARGAVGTEAVKQQQALRAIREQMGSLRMQQPLRGQFGAPMLTPEQQALMRQIEELQAAKPPPVPRGKPSAPAPEPPSQLAQEQQMLTAPTVEPPSMPVSQPSLAQIEEALQMAGPRPMPWQAQAIARQRGAAEARQMFTGPQREALMRQYLAGKPTPAQAKAYAKQIGFPPSQVPFLR